nr:hypothetical protein Q903MT_gene2527 [Picea sitchensis]
MEAVRRAGGPIARYDLLELYDREGEPRSIRHNACLCRKRYSCMGREKCTSLPTLLTMH